ncbi:hypothetical protein B0H13DRAFT_1928859 [Mycena leptocephala]|nr:hypothetical protein B0H13DRAFT_1928859 [Mycena leptocephala]
MKPLWPLPMAAAGPAVALRVVSAANELGDAILAPEVEPDADTDAETDANEECVNEAKEILVGVAGAAPVDKTGRGDAPHNDTPFRHQQSCLASKWSCSTELGVLVLRVALEELMPLWTELEVN